MQSKFSKVESISEKINVLQRKIGVSYIVEVKGYLVSMFFFNGRMLSNQQLCWIK